MVALPPIPRTAWEFFKRLNIFLLTFLNSNKIKKLKNFCLMANIALDIGAIMVREIGFQKPNAVEIHEEDAINLRNVKSISHQSVKSVA